MKQSSTLNLNRSFQGASELLDIALNTCGVDGSDRVATRFRIGFQSMIGLDSVVGRYPEGVTLNTSELGSGTLLTSAPNARAGPSFSVGNQARIGSTTRLD